jgi:ribonuclease P protein component
LLFEQGKSFYHAGIKVQYRIEHTSEEIKPAIRAGFVVSRRNFKRANMRNLLRRRMKEAYRHEYPSCLQIPDARQLHLLLIYNTKQIKPYSVIYEEIKMALIKLNELVCAKS